MVFAIIITIMVPKEGAHGSDFGAYSLVVFLR
jgi:hypothetical protein